MDTSLKTKIVNLAVKIVEERPEGINFTKLRNLIKEQMPEMNTKTVDNAIWDLHKTKKTKPFVYKSARGIFRHMKFRDEDVEYLREVEKLYQESISLKKEDIYEPLALYLKGELNECDNAEVFGVECIKCRWGSPNVLGVKKPEPEDYIQYIPELVACEVILDFSKIIESFGRAMSYRLFSSRIYIIIPDNCDEEDKARMEALSLLYGLGLIQYNLSKENYPQFRLMIRAKTHNPNLSYTNEFIAKIREKDEILYKLLF